jgi:hypothetical protein
MFLGTFDLFDFSAKACFPNFRPSLQGDILLIA